MAPFLDPAELEEHRRRNALQSMLLVGGIGVLTIVSAVLLWSWSGIIVAIASIAFIVGFGPRIAPETVMRYYRAQYVDPRRGGQLATLVEVLSARAELPAQPRLYVIPSSTLNAFATGNRERAAIAVTEGLLRKLSLREIAGVLAHEMSHIRNNDLAVMGLADAMTRFTQALAYVAVFLALMNVPAVLLGQPGFPWLGILLLYVAPTLSSLLQLALSRAREYDADREAALLTGDPIGLAAALRSLERYQGRFWEDLMLPVPGRRIPQPSLLRSHPETADRIRRLMELGSVANDRRIVMPDAPMFTLVGVGPGEMTPRYRWPGLWF